MASFRYQHGDRPLEGYEIQQGIGRGGFGEVYFAISDSGREVALKALQNYEDIEVRGVSHCMNLKSPYLVDTFDVVQQPGSEEPFIIMEYIHGPSLRDLLVDNPKGLGVEQATFILDGLIKGLAQLHEGIDKEAVTLGRRYAPGRGMRREQQPDILKIRHDVSNCRGREVRPHQSR